MRKSKDSGFLLFLWNREYENKKSPAGMLEPGCNCRRQCTTLVISLLLIILTYVMTVKRKFCPLVLWPQRGRGFPQGRPSRPPRGFPVLFTLHLCPISTCPSPSFSAIITEKNSPQKNFGSRKNPFYYHFYYYNGESCAVFCKIMSFSPWTGETGKIALYRHISA